MREKKCYENASKWDAFFDNQEEFEDDIFCDKLSLLKRIDNSSVIKDIFGTNRMISDDEMKMFFGPNDHSLEMKKVTKKLRRIECKHPLEFDKAKFENIAKEYNKRKEWTMGAMSESAANALKEQAKIRDVWTDGLCKIFKKNNFYFVHPIYFLNHLDKAGLFEFNPYEGKTLKKVTNRAYSTWSNFDGTNYDLSKKIVSNPGFAPYDPELFGEYEMNGYACINTLFMEKMDYVQNGITKKYSHEGIDFAGKRIVSSKTDKKLRTPIHSLINGIVVKTGNQDPNHYGKHIIISDGNNRLFLLGHLYDYADGIQVGSTVTPGQTIAYVGNTGNCAGQREKSSGEGTHLHLTVYITDTAKEITNKDTIKMSDSVDKIISNQDKNDFNYLLHSNSIFKIVNPFNYTESRS